MDNRKKVFKDWIPPEEETGEEAQPFRDWIPDPELVEVIIPEDKSKKK